MQGTEWRSECVDSEVGFLVSQGYDLPRRCLGECDCEWQSKFWLTVASLPCYNQDVSVIVCCANNQSVSSRLMIACCCVVCNVFSKSKDW